MSNAHVEVKVISFSLCRVGSAQCLCQKEESKLGGILENNCCDFNW